MEIHHLLLRYTKAVIPVTYILQYPKAVSVNNLSNVNEKMGRAVSWAGRALRGAGRAAVTAEGASRGVAPLPFQRYLA